MKNVCPNSAFLGFEGIKELPISIHSIFAVLYIFAYWCIFLQLQGTSQGSRYNSMRNPRNSSSRGREYTSSSYRGGSFAPRGEASRRGRGAHSSGRGRGRGRGGSTIDPRNASAPPITKRREETTKEYTR